MILPAALALEGIGKRYGNVVALDGGSLHVRSGTVHALLGENGAGKTTLMRVAFGMVHADSGIMRIDGRPTEIRSPAQAIAAGLGMVHQHFALVPAMTVAENIALGGRGLYSRRAAAALTREVGRSTGLALDPDALVGTLSIGGQQRLEIVKALARDARILILDEPTAVLAPSEADQLLRRLRAFADAGRTVVLVTHKLREALPIADDVTVIRHGATVYSAPSTEASEQSLIASILGEDRMPHLRSGVTSDPGAGQEVEAEASLDGKPSPEADDQGELDRGSTPSSAAGLVSTKAFVKPAHEAGPVIRASNLTVHDATRGIRVRNASFEIRGGEIAGIAAVEGSGQRELLRALAGRLRPSSGILVRPASVGFIPEDRQGDALIPDFSLVENLYLGDAGSQAGMVDWRTLEDRTTALLADYDVRAAGSHSRTATLSGGNQQKFVIARELEDNPRALIAENPTRGLDIKAAAAIRARLRSAASAGAAIVFHSSDLDEVLALADRVLVVYNGSVDEVPSNRELVGRRMLGLS